MLIEPIFTRSFQMLKPIKVEKRVQTDRIKVVISCRLEYRRGIDLLLGIIPRICAKYKMVDFIIIGDG